MLWRDFLGRFRPAGTPGAAAPRGVPTDRMADRATELSPLFALIDDIHADAERIRDQAIAQAEELRAEGRTHATEIVARARDRVESLGKQAALDMRSRAAAEQAELEAVHSATLSQLRTRIALRMPDYVQLVVAEARAMATPGPGL
jgi:hypothetical protein